jgi:hypothetical protein
MDRQACRCTQDGEATLTGDIVDEHQRVRPPRTFTLATATDSRCELLTQGFEHERYAPASPIVQPLTFAGEKHPDVEDPVVGLDGESPVAWKQAQVSLSTHELSDEQFVEAPPSTTPLPLVTHTGASAGHIIPPHCAGGTRVGLASASLPPSPASAVASMPASAAAPPSPASP